MDVNNLFDYIFHPRAIAVIGVTPGADENRFSGQYFLRSLVAAGYNGSLYAVGIEKGEYRGLKVYPRVTAIPAKIDLAIIAVPSRSVPQVLTDCGDKGIRAVHVFSAGFRELGGGKKIKLQQKIVTIARQRGIRFIGPNCMGVYYPSGGLSFNLSFTEKSGALSLISQSGSNAEYAIRMGMRRGIYFNKVISYGNGSDIAENDLLEYLIDDYDTKVIALYIEGSGNGVIFFK